MEKEASFFTWEAELGRKRVCLKEKHIWRPHQALSSSSGKGAGKAKCSPLFLHRLNGAGAGVSTHLINTLFFFSGIIMKDL